MSILQTKLQRIQALLEEANNLFNSLPADVQNNLYALHSVDGGLDCIRMAETAASECLERTTKYPIYGYYINLDERGSFYADVRNARGSTVYEIRDEPDDDSTSIFEDGFMRDKHDLDGLETYLRDLGIIPNDGRILPLNDFERLVDLSDASNPDESAAKPKAKMPGL